MTSLRSSRALTLVLLVDTLFSIQLFAGEPATGYGALPLSYARHLRTATAAGFEPATSRLTVEVTHVFTTGKVDFLLQRHSMLRLYGNYM